MKKVRFRLSFKLGVAIILTILLVGVLFDIVIERTYRNIFINNTSDKIIEKNSLISKSMVDLYSSDRINDSFDYFYEHREEAEKKVKENLEKNGSYSGLFSDIDYNIIDDLNRIFIDKKYSSEKYNGVKLAYAMSTCMVINSIIWSRINPTDHYEFRIYDESGNYKGMIIQDPEADHPFGIIVEGQENLDDLPGLKEAISEKNIGKSYYDPYAKDENGLLNMSVYTTLDTYEDEVCIVECFEDWTKMDESLSNSTFKLISGIVIILALLCVLIIITIYLIVTRKTTHMRHAIMEYEKNGDALIFNESLEKISKGTDEINLLASELMDMADSIDENIKERSRIAAEDERRKTELDIAASIQRSNLLSDFETVTKGLDLVLYASMTPLKEVGGDYYDAVRIDEDHIAFLIADVSDKGIPAAMFMMRTKSMIKQSLLTGQDPGTLLRDINNMISENNNADMFVTVWICLLTISTGGCSIVNAGHENPIIKTADNEWRSIDSTHYLPVGSISDLDYTAHTSSLDKGDIVFVYTDGVTDSKSPEGDRFGLERLITTLNSIDSDEPEVIIRAVKDKLDTFMAGETPFDDITMLCFRY